MNAPETFAVHVHNGRRTHYDSGRLGMFTLCGQGWVATFVKPEQYPWPPVCKVCTKRRPEGKP